MSDGAVEHLQAGPGCHWRTLHNGLFRHCCSIKGCDSKAGNGRCRLLQCHVEVDSTGGFTGRCQEFKRRTLGRIR